MKHLPYRLTLDGAAPPERWYQLAAVYEKMAARQYYKRHASECRLRAACCRKWAAREEARP